MYQSEKLIGATVGPLLLAGSLPLVLATYGFVRRVATGHFLPCGTLQLEADGSSRACYPTLAQHHR